MGLSLCRFSFKKTYLFTIRALAVLDPFLAALALSGCGKGGLLSSSGARLPIVAKPSAVEHAH